MLYCNCFYIPALLIFLGKIITNINKQLIAAPDLIETKNNLPKPFLGENYSSYPLYSMFHEGSDMKQ